MKFSRATIVTMVFAAALLTACSSASPTPAVEDPAGAESARSTFAEGVLLPARYVDLAFNTNGRVAEVLAAEGSAVKAGEIIARLEVAAPEARQADVARAALEIEAARSEQAAAAAEALNANQALETLSATGAVAVQQLRFTIADLALQVAVAQDQLDDELSRSEPDELKVTRLQAQLELLKAQQDKAGADLAGYTDENVPAGAYEAAQARLAAAQQRQTAAESRLASANAALLTAQAALNGAELIAPWDGVLTSSNLKVGGWVTAGVTAATLADFSAWTIETDNLTEIGVVGVEAGQTVDVTFDALPEFSTTGTVETIASQYVEKRGDVTYTVRILLDAGDPSLRWGMTAAVQFAK